MVKRQVSVAVLLDSFVAASLKMEGERAANTTDAAVGCVCVCVCVRARVCVYVYAH